jgi:hypothetical protein
LTLGSKRDQIAVDQAARFSATADGDLQCDVDGPADTERPGAANAVLERFAFTNSIA